MAADEERESAEGGAFGAAGPDLDLARGVRLGPYRGIRRSDVAQQRTDELR